MPGQSGAAGGRRMRVVVAPDSFKGSARAGEVARALAEGWLSVRADDDLVLLPMADGGEGTLEAIATAHPAAERRPVVVLGPDDRPVTADWLLLTDAGIRTGVVELASTSGIELLAAQLPLTAHTRGFGQAIVAALDAGVDRLVLAIGGSASTDGGAGLLTELGARLTDAGGTPIAAGAGGLASLAEVDLTGLRPQPRGGTLVLTDVTNPLLGATGAAAVFGPQKGLTTADVMAADRSLGRFAGLVAQAATGGPDATRGVPSPTGAGAGAAGGAGFGLLVWGARLENGAAAVARELRLAEAIAGADLVITGEGRFDGQSEGGKVPAHVRDLAARAGVPVALVAGTVEAHPAGFAASLALVPELAGSTAASIADPRRWLVAAGARLAGWPVQSGGESNR
ncbi:glycerate kinase [Herbiconiux liangxiaofengii]|uniref:glycerate kinase n=1 Tax=Herbiconiux liangxiaofengii TaxID=3342795 RepID=UPI0035B8DA50